MTARHTRSMARLGRRLGAAPTRASLAVALEAYPGEIYLARRDGVVEVANERGGRRLDVETEQLTAAMLGSIRAFERCTPGGEFAVAPVRVDGHADLFLVTRGSVPVLALDGRIVEVRSRWALTPRQVDVLRRLALGDATKDIAGRLRMSPRTVDQHIATILDRAGVDTRIRLVALLWGGLARRPIISDPRADEGLGRVLAREALVPGENHAIGPPMPQKPQARAKDKKRLTKRLANWRAKQELATKAPAAAADASKTPAKTPAAKG